MIKFSAKIDKIQILNLYQKHIFLAAHPVFGAYIKVRLF